LDRSPDPIRALSTRQYLGLTASIYWRRFRKKLPRNFRCDCGAAYVWGRFEYQRWDQIHEFACYDCGDIYQTLHNTIVTITPNPLNRCLIAALLAQGKTVKKLVSRRLSPEVIEHFKSTGSGWQSRIDETLRKALKRKAS
jgi:BrnA antitoxin of type II toxin-antitoxin system